MVYSIGLSEIENRLESYNNSNILEKTKELDIDYRFSLSDLENRISYNYNLYDTTVEDGIDSCKKESKQLEEYINLYNNAIMFNDSEDTDELTSDTDYTDYFDGEDHLNSDVDFLGVDLTDEDGGEDSLDADVDSLDVELTNEGLGDLLEYSSVDSSYGDLDKASLVNTSNYSFNQQDKFEQCNKETDSKDINLLNNSLSVDKASVVGVVDNKNFSKSARNYSSLDISKVYNIVAVFMKMNGVKNKGISQELLVKEFGSDVIRRLLSKSYLISLPDGTLTFNK